MSHHIFGSDPSSSRLPDNAKRNSSDELIQGIRANVELARACLQQRLPVLDGPTVVGLHRLRAAETITPDCVAHEVQFLEDVNRRDPHAARVIGSITSRGCLNEAVKKYWQNRPKTQ